MLGIDGRNFAIEQELNVQISYTLKAQLTPVNKKDMADDAGTSVFRAE